MRSRRSTWRPRRARPGSVQAAADPRRGQRAEAGHARLVGGGRPLDVVLDAAELEAAVAVAQRVGPSDVAVERHADTPRVEEVGPVRPCPAELQVAVAEDDGPVANAVQAAFVLLRGLDPEAVVVAERAAVDVEDSVQLDPRLEREDPALLGAEPRVGGGER